MLQVLEMVRFCKIRGVSVAETNRICEFFVVFEL
jgi:hypothetical protein